MLSLCPKLCCAVSLLALTAALPTHAAPPAGTDRVKQIVKGQGAAPRHLSIRVDIITASLAGVNQLGVNLSHISLSEQLAPGQDAEANSTPTQAVMRFTYGNVAAQLGALLAKMPSGPLSTVFLQAADGEPNLLNADAIQQIPTGSAPILGTFFAGRGVQITPHINADGTVTLTLTSPPGGATDLVRGNASAGLKTMTMRCTVYSGGAVAFLDTADASEHYRGPWYPDSPLRVIFITPTIIDNKSAAGSR